MKNTIARGLPTNRGQFAATFFPEIGNSGIPGLTGKHQVAITQRATVATPVIFTVVVALVPADQLTAAITVVALLLAPQIGVIEQAHRMHTAHALKGHFQLGQALAIRAGHVFPGVLQGVP